MSRLRDTWIDYTKVFACILVALGHFFQSMVVSGIIPSTALYDWFNKTIYYFHVPLFFICSGFLHQKMSCVKSFASWKTNVIKKGITLGIPYVVFSFATWVLKFIFSSAINIQNEGLLKTLFLAPTSPYWYLYALFFIFLVTPTFPNNRLALWGLLGAVVLKIVSLFLGGTDIYAVSTVLSNELWFVLGMVLCILDISTVCRSRNWLHIGVCSAAVFLIASVIISAFDLDDHVLSLIMGFFGCASTVLIMLKMCKVSVVWRLFAFLSQYTMPIFLMHTIFAAGLRAILMKIGIMNAAIHIVLGLMLSFAGPIIAAEVMKRMKLDVLIYPGKYIRISK